MGSCKKSPVVSRIQYASYVFFYAVFLNVPYWIASRTLGLIPHGWFCIEYVLVGVIALFLPRFFSSLLVVLAIALDMLYAICSTYYIIPFQVLTNIRGLEHFSSQRIEWVAAVGVVTLCFAGLAVLFTVSSASLGSRAKVALSLIVFCFGIVSAQFAFAQTGTGRARNLSLGIDKRDSVSLAYYSNIRPARFPSRWLLLRTLFQHRVEYEANSARYHIATFPSASAVGTRLGGIEWKNAQEPNLVLIVSESWGLSTQSAIADALTAPYFRQDLLARYKVLQGTVPFYGATVAGEARELCGSTLGLEIMKASQRQLVCCLPGQLAAMGYHNIALHGNDGRMFDRSAWYPRIGFDETWFNQQFQDKNLPNCVGAFTGTCDAAIADWIGNRLRTSDNHPQFIYWMTLNSHLPVPDPVPLSSPASCAFSPSLATHGALCSWFQLVANVHQSVSRLALSAEERPTVFVIVGDHAPPFADIEVRNDFSHKMVPYTVLIPLNNSKILPRRTPRRGNALAFRPGRSNDEGAAD